ncbi:hypothetical protein GCM10009430_45900 [Aquimarina litoralis]|uniref:DUF4274 domain-containing protein n=1 Tax=Aquimarina litoralis TaxID=584605 RepID=A0ABP3UHJ1_9FLAO
MKISQEEYDALESEIILEFAAKQSQEVLYQMIMEWNWDSSDSFLNWLVDNPLTDKSTILMIYWKSAPRYFKQFQNRNEVLKKQAYSINDFDFVEKVEKNYLNDFYNSSIFEFEPSFWADEYAEIKLVKPIPEIMFKKIHGKIVEHPSNFTEGCPPELDTLLEELYEKNH